MFSPRPPLPILPRRIAPFRDSRRRPVASSHRGDQKRAVSLINSALMQRENDTAGGNGAVSSKCRADRRRNRAKIRVERATFIAVLRLRFSDEIGSDIVRIITAT